MSLDRVAAAAAAAVAGPGGLPLRTASKFWSAPDLTALADTMSSNGDLTRLALSDTKSALYDMECHGVLSKRGFWWLRRWVLRVVVLRGRMLHYYDCDAVRSAGRQAFGPRSPDVVTEVIAEGVHSLPPSPSAASLPSGRRRLASASSDSPRSFSGAPGRMASTGSAGGLVGSGGGGGGGGGGGFASGGLPPFGATPSPPLGPARGSAMRRNSSRLSLLGEATANPSSTSPRSSRLSQLLSGASEDRVRVAPRGSLELTADTRVEEVDASAEFLGAGDAARTNVFKVVPGRAREGADGTGGGGGEGDGGPVWYLQADNAGDMRRWIEALRRHIALIARTTPATPDESQLPGEGSVRAQYDLAGTPEQDRQSVVPGGLAAMVGPGAVMPDARGGEAEADSDDGVDDADVVGRFDYGLVRRGRHRATGDPALVLVVQRERFQVVERAMKAAQEAAEAIALRAETAAAAHAAEVTRARKESRRAAAEAVPGAHSSPAGSGSPASGSPDSSPIGSVGSRSTPSPNRGPPRGARGTRAPVMAQSPSPCMADVALGNESFSSLLIVPPKARAAAAAAAAARGRSGRAGADRPWMPAPACARSPTRPHRLATGNDMSSVRRKVAAVRRASRLANAHLAGCREVYREADVTYLVMDDLRGSTALAEVDAARAALAKHEAAAASAALSARGSGFGPGAGAAMHGGGRAGAGATGATRLGLRGGGGSGSGSGDEDEEEDGPVMMGADGGEGDDGGDLAPLQPQSGLAALMAADAVAPLAPRARLHAAVALVIEAVADALAAMHGKKLVHRNVCIDSVRITRERLRLGAGPATAQLAGLCTSDSAPTVTLEAHRTWAIAHMLSRHRARAAAEQVKRCPSLLESLSFGFGFGFGGGGGGGRGGAGSGGAVDDEDAPEGSEARAIHEAQVAHLRMLRDDHLEARRRDAQRLRTLSDTDRDRVVRERRAAMGDPSGTGGGLDGIVVASDAWRAACVGGLSGVPSIHVHSLRVPAEEVARFFRARLGGVAVASLGVCRPDTGLAAWLRLLSPPTGAGALRGRAGTSATAGGAGYSSTAASDVDARSPVGGRAALALARGLRDGPAGADDADLDDRGASAAAVSAPSVAAALASAAEADPTGAWLDAPADVRWIHDPTAADGAPSLSGAAPGRAAIHAGAVAPEVAAFGYFGPAADVWALGIVLYQLLVGAPPPPLPGSRRQVIDALCAGTVPLDDPACVASVPDGARQLLRQMLEPDASRRVTAHGVRSHPWIVETVTAARRSSHSAKPKVSPASRSAPRAPGVGVGAVGGGGGGGGGGGVGGSAHGAWRQRPTARAASGVAGVSRARR